MEVKFLTHEFTAPSGNTYVIREQNGADDDILSNVNDARTGLNFSKFIAGIVTNTSVSNTGRLTPDQAHVLPVLDKYCILIQSRIFSLGNEFEFSYEWPKADGDIHTEYYTLDLNELLHDYSDPEAITSEILESKPDAIPFYPDSSSILDIPIVTRSGKNLTFDILTTKSEYEFLNMPLDKQTKNSILTVRNLKLEVSGKYEKVSNFQMFSVKDMVDIRNAVATYDPTFHGTTNIVNTLTTETIKVPVLGLQGFFYLGE